MAKSVRQSYIDMIYAMDWKEKPVGVGTFLSHPDYLGSSFDHGRSVYPAWKAALKRVFDDPTKYIIVFTGAMGLGKTSIAIAAMAYLVYLLHCMRDPWAFLKKSRTGKLAISFFNLNKSMSSTIGYEKLQQYMSNSPWFRRHADKIKEGKTVEVFMPHVDFLLSSPYSQGYGVTGADIITGILDEVDSPNAGVPQKKKVLSTYEQTIDRFKNRFVVAGKSFGKFFIVTSKQETLGFIDTFIAQKKNSSDTLIFDYALWDVKPSSDYCGEKFMVAVPGDAFHDPKILRDDDLPATYVAQGYEILHVPVELRSSFEENLVQQIRNTAGRSIASSRSDKLFKSDMFIKECFDKTKENPMRATTVEIGLKDDIALFWYLDMSKIRVPLDNPRFIHMDFGLSGDALGLAMSTVADFVDMDVKMQDGTFTKQRLPVVETDFAIRLKARENDSIPLHVVSKFVLDLRAAGFNVQLFSADLLMASAYSFQVLTDAGISTKYLSVDKTDGPYVLWRDMVITKRWRCHYDSLILFEAKHLLHDRRRQKVDHPLKVEETEVLESGDIKDYVMAGSKDIVDGICGSVCNAVISAGDAVDLTGVIDVLRGVKKSDDTDDVDIASKLLGTVDGKKIVSTQELSGNADAIIKSIIDNMRS